MKRFAILFSVAAVFVCVTAAYYLSYRLSGDRQTQEPQAPTTSFLQPPSGQRESEEALDLLIAAKYYERIGDHMRNIAEAYAQQNA